MYPQEFEGGQTSGSRRSLKSDWANGTGTLIMEWRDSWDSRNGLSFLHISEGTSVGSVISVARASVGVIGQGSQERGEGLAALKVLIHLQSFLKLNGHCFEENP